MISGHPRLRAAASWTITVLAALVVWFALVAPHRRIDLTAGGFLRLPIEGLVVIAVTLVLPTRARRIVSIGFGVILAALVIVKVLDLGFRAVLDRPFDLLNDWYYFGPGVGVLSDSIGRGPARAAAVAAAVAALALLVIVPLCVLRVTRVAAEHQTASIRVISVLGAAWVLFAVAGLQFSPVARVASSSAAGLAVDEVNQLRADIKDRGVFDKEISNDAFGKTPSDQLLTGLRGKDVLLVFVESYGRIAVQDSSFSPKVDAVLDAGTNQLRGAGYSSRSAFLTSPTFGAASWLAHSTLQSGLWVDSQQRYDQLMSNDRLTLTSAFGRAGWRTVSDVPSNTDDWPDGSSFYHFDKQYDSRNVGYQGPSFSYALMPDQYTMAEFRRMELTQQHRKPVMAEIDLVSSHHPWTPLPHLVPWGQVGDGSVFDDQPSHGLSPDEAFRDPNTVRALYGQSIEYSLSTLISYLQKYPDPNLVVIMLGDHQPHSYVTGENPGHDVPITVIAHDRNVMQRTSGWHWQDGLRPSPDAPVWPMDSFRDRFFTAFGSQPHPTTSAAGSTAQH